MSINASFFENLSTRPRAYFENRPMIVLKAFQNDNDGICVYEKTNYVHFNKIQRHQHHIKLKYAEVIQSFIVLVTV